MSLIKLSLLCACLAVSLLETEGQTTGCSLKTSAPRFRRSIFDFSAELIKRVAQQEENDFVVSPLSIWTILSVVSEGAEDETYEELRRVLHLNRQRCIKNNYYRLIKNITTQNSEVIFQRAGVMVADSNFEVKKHFMKAIQKAGTSAVIPLDFNETENATRVVNEYVSITTAGEINEALTPEDFNDTVMMLIDTVYFKGQWTIPFDPKDTVSAEFYDEKGDVIGYVNLMYRSAEYNITYLDVINANILELPYGMDGKFSMLIFLPKRGESLTNVIENLKDISLNAIFKKFERTKSWQTKVDVSLPRFKISSELDTLKELLIDMGIQRVFEENTAELRGISDVPIYISKVLHKAQVEVTEEGTVGAGFTDVGFSARTRNDEFIANKPFLYLIVDKPTQIILFSGAYSKPSLF